MDSSLITVCVYCASLLFRNDLPSIPGWSGEFAGSYTTIARRENSATVLNNDESDLTEKLLLLGVRRVIPPETGLGAGTPAGELRFRIAIGDAHDESDQTDRVPDRVIATGNGRAENFEAMARIPVGTADSVELGLAQRFEKTTDFVNLGGSLYQYSETRTTLAQRVDGTIGWRHRGRRWEAAAAYRAVRPEGQYNTALVFRSARAWLNGASAEIRGERGGWQLSASGEFARGSMTVAEQTNPIFAHVSYPATGELKAGGLSVSKSFGPVDLVASAVRDESTLPFVVIAVLGEETRAFDQAFRPFSSTGEWQWNLSARARISPGIHVRAFARVTTGNETVRLVSAVDPSVSRSISVSRSGPGPATQFLLGGGADFSIGGRD